MVFLIALINLVCLRCMLTGNTNTVHLESNCAHKSTFVMVDAHKSAFVMVDALKSAFVMVHAQNICKTLMLLLCTFLLNTTIFNIHIQVFNLILMLNNLHNKMCFCHAKVLLKSTIACTTKTLMFQHMTFV